jgi:hypothetical protein
MEARSCRDNANRCIEMAYECRGDPVSRSILFKFAREWLELSIEYEKDAARRLAET